jgi:Fe-S-cluster containining protein
MKSNPAPISNKDNTPLVCFRCGICCRKFQVRLDQRECQRIARKLNISWTEFLDTYIDPRWPGTRSYLICQVNGACVFLQQNEKDQIATCLIHPFRPESCHDWLAGIDKLECIEGLENMNRNQSVNNCSVKVRK